MTDAIPLTDVGAIDEPTMRRTHSSPDIVSHVRPNGIIKPRPAQRYRLDFSIRRDAVVLAGPHPLAFRTTERAAPGARRGAEG